MIQRTKEVITAVVNDSVSGILGGTIIGGASFSILMLLDWREFPEDIFEALGSSCFLVCFGAVCGSIIGGELGFSYGVCKFGYGLFKSFLPEPITLEKRLENAQYSGEIDERFLCEITCQIMQDPVVGNDGHHYERSFINRWMEQKRTSPFTTRPLTIKSNDKLRNEILKFVEEVEKNSAASKLKNRR